jgi:hypothetical protein
LFSFKTWAGIAVALLAVCVLLVASIRMVDPTPAQREALALVNSPMPPVRGRDGSDAAWLLGYDAPAAQQAKRAAELRDYLGRKYGPDPAPMGATDPRKLWVAFPKEPEAGDGVCKTRTGRCIDYVRQYPAKVDATLKAHARRLATTLEFQTYDGFRYGLLPSQRQEMAKLESGRRLVKTRLAWLFARGQQAEAVAQTCSDISAWRRLGSDTDSLVGSLVGVAHVRDSLVLLAEMLAEIPSTTPLPESCAAALAPVAEIERSLCAAAALEFRGQSANLYQDLEAEKDDDPTFYFMIRYLMDKENTDAMHASSVAQYCSAGGKLEIRSDTPTVDWFRPDEICPSLRLLGDPIGCMFAMRGMGNGFTRYQDRRLDQAQMLGLMKTLLWLRKSGTPQLKWPTLLNSRPASLGLQRTPRIEGNMLVVPMWDQTYHEDFRLPIRPADGT